MMLLPTMAGWQRLGCLLAAGFAVGLPAAESNPVLDWNAALLKAVRAESTAPTLCSRNAAILHAAIYDAVNSIVRSHHPYRFLLDPPAPVDPEAAAAGAGHAVLGALYPSFQGSSDNLLEEWQATEPPTAALTNGLALGREVARRMLALRADDGASTQVPYIPSADPGQWRRTPPFFRPPLDPHWRFVRPFAVDRMTEPYVSPPPPPFDSAEYAASYEEVRSIGARRSAVRTADQAQSAVFWSDFTYTVTPPGHWQEVTATIILGQGTDLAGSARLMALLCLAQADSAIACWETKYRYNTWRPVTAIRRGDEDGNAATVAEPEWEALLNAPNFPEYPSGHSIFSQASAAILRAFYGTDALTFTATSDSQPGVQRTYRSLQACADEIAQGRVWGGIHFGFASAAGKRAGGGSAIHLRAPPPLEHDPP
ncbi:MAG: vanadium-dependent haloperoxidase, partial [Verrucomicrobiota bacterium]